MNLCILGPPKTGKTRSIDTLPGRTILFNIDPDGFKALRRAYTVCPIGSSLSACDTLNTPNACIVFNYCTVQPTVSLSPTREARATYGTDAYKHFITDINAALVCDKCDNVVLDGLTGLSDITLLAVMRLNQRRTPNSQADYGDAIEKLAEIVSVCSSSPKTFIMLCHTLIEKDELSGRVIENPLVYGKQLPGRLLAMFDTVFRTDVTNNVYSWITKPTPLMQTIGSRSLDNLADKISQDFSKLNAVARNVGRS